MVGFIENIEIWFDRGVLALSLSGLFFMLISQA
jgi:hypothetical protein